MKLSVRLIRCIHRRLRRRHRATGDRRLLAVGIGWPRKQGDRGLERKAAIVYLVKRRKTPHRIPPQISIYLTHHRRGKKHRKLHTFPTHVIEIGKTTLTCLRASPTDGSDSYTAGALVSWGNPAVYGVLTVGHGTPGGVGSQVAFALEGGPTIHGEAIFVTSDADPLDAALIQFGPDVTLEILNDYLLPAPGAAAPQVADIDAINADATSKLDGITCTADNNLPIGLQAFFPKQTIIDGCYNLTDILMAQGADNTFAPGTSGSVWSVSTEVMGIQVAGTVSTPLDDGLHPWLFGFAQPVSDYINWAKKSLGGGAVKLICIL